MIEVTPTLQEKAEKRLAELLQAKEQTMANYNAILGAISEIQNLLKTEEAKEEMK